jgi:hypothetical protein
MWHRIVRNVLSPASEVTSKPRNESTRSLLPASCWSLVWLPLRPWRWWRYVHPKHRWTFTGPHGITSQKIVIFKEEQLTTSSDLRYAQTEYGQMFEMRNADSYYLLCLNVIFSKIFLHLYYLITQIYLLICWLNHRLFEWHSSGYKSWNEMGNDHGCTIGTVLKRDVDASWNNGRPYSGNPLSPAILKPGISE